MFDHNGLNRTQGTENELGMVICKHCGDLLYTLPTNRVQKMYGVCNACEKTTTEHSGEDEK
jgi:hypothetical protein